MEVGTENHLPWLNNRVRRKKKPQSLSHPRTALCDQNTELRCQVEDRTMSTWAFGGCSKPKLEHYGTNPPHSVVHSSIIYYATVSADKEYRCGAARTSAGVLQGWNQGVGGGCSFSRTPFWASLLLAVPSFLWLLSCWLAVGGYSRLPEAAGHSLLCGSFLGRLFLKGRQESTSSFESLILPRN